MVRTTTQNPAIQKGIDAVYALNADTVLREQIRQRDKAIRDYENEMAIARSEGRAEGIAEGRAEGRAEGIVETLITLVKKGILTLAQAAEEAHMSIAEFEAKTGWKA